MKLQDLAPAAAAKVLAAAGVRSGPVTGPWINGFWVSLPFPPMSKSNARRFRAGTSGTWNQLNEFETKVRAAFTSAVPSGWVVGEGKVKDRPTVVSVMFARTLLDVSNLPKSIHDAAEGVVYVTDASVRASVEVTERARNDQTALILFAQLDSDASDDELDEAVVALYRAGRTRFAASSSRKVP